MVNHSIFPGQMFSLYIPAAGFLWTDDYVWDPIDNNFVYVAAAVEPETGAQFKRRVVMSDRIRTSGTTNPSNI